MNKDVLIDVGSQLARLRMYPIFDICHYLITALHVRDDIQQYPAGEKRTDAEAFRDERSDRVYVKFSIVD